MPSPTGSIFSTQSTRIQEVINKSVGIWLPVMDKMWTDTIVSNQKVGPSDHLGRDHLLIKTFTGGLTGVVEPAGPSADFPLYGDPSNTSIGSKLFTQGLSKVFPDALGGMNQASYRLGVPMRAILTNLALTLGEMQAEASEALIGEIIVPKLEGFARYMSQVVCNYWYLSQNSYYALAALGGASGTGWDKTVDTNLTLKVNLAYSNYAVDRFMVGMRVQIYDATGATLRQTASLTTSTVLVVTAVDESVPCVYFRAVDNLAVNGMALADTDIIVLANSKGSSTTPFASSPYFTGIAGINSWMKFGDANGATDNADNCLLGGERVGTASGFNANINVNVHPEFKSLLFNRAGAPLTEHYLRQVLARFHAAKGKYGHIIDCLIASEGVWLSYEAQKIHQQWYDRTGRIASLNKEGGPGEFVMEFDGRRYHGYTSTYVENGTVYGIRKQNNWTRYSPPEIQNTRKFDRAPGWNPFRFVGGALTGTQSNQIPIQIVQSNRTFVTEGVQMPGWLRMQLVPEQTTGLKITNCAEDRLYVS